MKLRKLKYGCEHVDEMHPYGHYVEHEVWEKHSDECHSPCRLVICPGGVFLPDDTLVIEKVDGEWPEWTTQTGRGYSVVDKLVAAKAKHDALSVREAE